jgi:hypothetical protein
VLSHGLSAFAALVIFRTCCSISSRSVSAGTDETTTQSDRGECPTPQATADEEIGELIQEHDRLQSELTATRGVLEEILDAEDNGDRALKDRLPDTDRSQL